MTRVILDTVGQPHTYKELLQRRLKDPSLEIIVESKADFNFPVVSAASICAKVTRDQVLSQWKFPEKITEIDSDYGCGYPSDPKAKAWLRRNFDGAFGFPNLVRFSWKTCSVILEDHKTNVDFKDPYIDPKVGQKFQTSLKNQQTLNFTKKETSEEDELKVLKMREANKAIKPLGLRRAVKL